MKAFFRNGMRMVQAEQLPSGDWRVREGRRSWLESDEEFRMHWEPWSAEARRMFGRYVEAEREVVARN